LEVFKNKKMPLNSPEGDIFVAHSVSCGGKVRRQKFLGAELFVRGEK
jgi:hypothetical protein